MPTQPWLSVLAHPCRSRKDPRHLGTIGENREAVTVDLSVLNRIPPRYHKQTPQNFCTIEESFASISPAEYCRKNGFERPLNLFQLISWVLFSIDIILFYVLLGFSLSPIAAVRHRPLMLSMCYFALCECPNLVLYLGASLINVLFWVFLSDLLRHNFWFNRPSCPRLCLYCNH